MISTDDMMARMNVLSEGLKEEGGIFVKRGTPWDKAHTNGACFISATDIEALFPSLEARSSADICKTSIIESDLQVQNIDLEEALLYLMVNEKLETTRPKIV